MVNRYMERCSTSPVTRKTQIKTTRKYHLPPVRMASIKKTKRGAWVAHLVRHPTLNPSSGFNPQVHEFKTYTGLHAGEEEKKKKKTRNSKCWRGCREKGTLLHSWWECEMVQPLWKTAWKFLKK